MQTAARQHLTDVVEVPVVLAEGATDEAVGLAAMHGMIAPMAVVFVRITARAMSGETPCAGP